ncbi:MAG: 30S ribosomal protein S12 methylthiotransferase RimO, partial [Lentisphaerae bacterium]|nr:30S ribosomal protein S12 methylthiotransferase RimO [Lentisphaerota bacterium]
RTTCLVGFPGETDAHFAHLLDYVQQAKFDHLGVFVYSPEEETAAFEMADVPDPEVAASRRDRLMAAQRAVVDERAHALAGSLDTALLLRRERRAWIARLPRQAPDVDGETRVTGVPPDACPGTFIPVRMTGGKAYDLKAQAI